jgi:hypothetical protein
MRLRSQSFKWLLIKLRLMTASPLIDIDRIEGLAEDRRADPLLADTCRQIAGPQVRNLTHARLPFPSTAFDAIIQAGFPHSIKSGRARQVAQKESLTVH